MAAIPPPPPITTATATSPQTEPPPTPPLTNGVLPSPPSLALTLALPYGKCNKNFSATTGGHVLDGCGEFMPSLTSTDPRTSLYCDACGCHRSFHRQTDHPPPSSPPNSPSPISSTTPAHMTLLAINNPQPPQGPPPARRNKKKRFRTKFSEDQKKRMQEFADRIGWKMWKKDEEMIMGFCMDIGVTKRVLKVWLHNHKNMKTLASTSLTLN
ncbi:hypothetical protein SSX86_018933 [Deinandra increscens subsp. villosa]|uniref:ZF-HD dimerization-type domain-containing protein n=1 Tax=Deinandra increscens subsp. villosa TaxID=3103831 RepID=A0AAP0CRN4_9ASTR